jgi:hypothetical protein
MPHPIPSISRPLADISYIDGTDNATERFISKDALANFLGEKELCFIVSAEPKVVERIRAVERAMEIAAAGTPLFLRTSIKDDVSNLKRYVRKNTATSLEGTMNRAIVENAVLLAKFGHLELVNDGKGVLLKWTDSTTGKRKQVDIDGLIKNSVVLLMNETKSRLHPDDLIRFAKAKTALEQAIDNPGRFTTEPAGILPQLKGLRVVPIVSTNGCADGAKEACAAEGIHILEPDGSGYAVTIFDEPAPPIA